MVPTKNIGPTGGSEEPQETREKDSQGRPVIRDNKGDSKNSKFKEVLNNTDDQAAPEEVTVEEESVQVTLSPLALAGQPPVKKEKPVIALTADETPVVAEPEVTETTVAKGPVVQPTVPKKDGSDVEDATSAPAQVATSRTVTPTGKPVPLNDQAVPTQALPVDERKTPVTAVAPEGKAKDVQTDEVTTKKPKDDATVNLAAQPQIAQQSAPLTTAINQVPEQSVKAREVLIKLADEMISRLDQITAPDRTDTTITLKHPPLFNGAELVITEFKSSQKEFNVTFTGLSPDARMLIEVQQNQEALRTALLEKGYTLQMVTIDQKIPGLESSKTEGSPLDLRQREKEGDAEADAGNPK